MSSIAALALMGCERVSALLETELDDSAEGVSGRWEIVEMTEATEDCEMLDAAAPRGDTVVVEVATDDHDAGGARRDDAPDSKHANSAQKHVEVMVCDGADCLPVHGRYSRFERAEAGWRVDAYEADWSRYPACLARHMRASFGLVADGEARIALESSRGEWLLEGDEDCHDDIAREREEALECYHRKVYELRRPVDASG
ncbi:MAG: hypothetical protein ACQEVA_12850 [Myxococcota bacterium]